MAVAPLPQGPLSADTSSRVQWKADLTTLLHDAKRRFGDVCWTLPSGTNGAKEEVWAHKGRSCPCLLTPPFSYRSTPLAIVYARSGAQFQAKYLSGARLLSVSAGAASSSSLALPLPSAQSHDSLSPVSGYFRVPSPGAASFKSVASTVRPPIPLAGTDPLFFRSCLEFLYTGDTDISSVFSFLYDDGLASSPKEDATAKLAEVRWSMFTLA
jgi:hypothetical protein